MTFTIDHIFVKIEKENNGIRLTTDKENWFIPNQTIEETKEVLVINYKIVKNHFQNKTRQLITDTDLGNVCFKIVLHYYQMYNHWRTMYKKHSNRDLTFLQKDFEHPFTSYQIIDYFKNEYPDNYADKCESILDMTTEQFAEYMVRKEQFENR